MGSLRKDARVLSNDPGRRVEILRLEATVKRSIAVSSTFVPLDIPAGQTTSYIVDIVGELKDPLRLEVVEFTPADRLRYRIDEVSRDRSYRIHIENIPGPAGITTGQMRLRTSYPNRPEIVLSIKAMIR